MVVVVVVVVDDLLVVVVVVVVVVDEKATVPKYPNHLRRLKSPLKQPQMLYGSKMG